MTDQPKLEGSPEPWHHVAREFGDHDMETDGGWNPLTTVRRCTITYDDGKPEKEGEK